jgi:subtilisin family serine protease
VDHFARLLPIKISSTGSLNQGFYKAGLDYLVANPTFADVVNLSISNFFAIPDSTNALYALAETAILIGAAGNEAEPFGADTRYPESHPAVLTIAGTDRFDQHAVFPDGTASDGGNSVDFAGPAVDIVAAAWCDPGECPSGSDPFNPFAFNVVSGNSFGTPMVAGIAALGLSLHPGLTRYELEVALRGSSVDLGAPGKDTVFGWGRVNAHQAVLLLQSILFADGFEGGDTSAWTTSSP